MGFKSIIVLPVIRPDQDYHRRELWHLKQDIKKIFKRFGRASCSYLLRNSESSFYEYEENFAIIDFKNKESAARALQAIRNGEITINGITITGRSIEMTHCPMNTLPDNCLLEIFQHLSTYERLKLSGVSKRWSEVSQCLWKVTKIDLRDRRQEHRNNKYLINNASHLKDIYCYDNRLKVIGDHCKNLESIALEFSKYTTRKGLDRACIQYERQTLQQFANLTRLMLKIRTPQYAYFSFLQHLPSTMIEIHVFNDIPGMDTARSKGWSERDRILERFLELRKMYGRKTLDLSRFTELQALTLRSFYLDHDSLVGSEKLQKLSCLHLDNCYATKLFLDNLKFFTILEHLSLKRISMDYEDMWLILKRNRNLKYLSLPQMTNFSMNENIWHRALELEHLKVLCWTDIEHKIRDCGTSTSIEYIEHDDVYLSERRTILFLENFPKLKVYRKLSWGGTGDWFISQVQDVIVSRADKAPMRYYHDPRRQNFRDRFFPLATYNSGNFEHSDIVNDEDAKMLRCNEWDGWYIEHPSSSSKPATQVDDASTKPRRTSASSIDRLPDNCLNTIFNCLPLDDKITASEVCKRWSKLLGDRWTSCTRFNIRELSCHENREKCLVRCGRNFSDVHLYKSCGFSGIRNHCPNVKSLALDFRINRCKCPPSSKELYSLWSLQATMMKLKHLSRIMLKDATVFESDVLQYLPEFLEEIHVFNRRSIKHDEGPDPQIILDLSRYPKLRALTLIDNLESHQRGPRKVEVHGLNKLEKLLYLRVSGVKIPEYSDDCLKNIQHLQYLSLPLSMLSADNFGYVIGNNPNLEYLDITDDFSGVPISKFLPVLTLQRLKYLRMVNLGSTSDNEDSAAFQEIPGELEFTDGVPRLEILDCEGPPSLPQDLLLQLVGASPNLAVMSVCVDNGNFAEELVALAESNVMARSGQRRDIRAFLGIEGFRLCRNLRLHADGVILCDVPAQQYRTVVERHHWVGWGIEDDRANTFKLCSELLQCLSH